MDITFNLFLETLFNNPILIFISILVIGLMLVNGMTDAPNAIATCISTRAIKPKSAITLAAIFDALGVLVMTILSANVASTIANLVNFGSNYNYAILAVCMSILATILWAYGSSRLGIPTSESHALIAGLTGASIAINDNFSGVNFGEWQKVLFGLFLSSVGGFIIGYIISKLFKIIFKRSDRTKVNKKFKKAQVFSGVMMAFMHGAQDGQKFIGIFILGIMLSLAKPMEIGIGIPLWLIIIGAITMGLGVSIGGYKIIKNVGIKMVKMEPYEGTAADLSGIICLLVSEGFGLPVSTTHTKTLSIMGVGAAKRLSNVNWNVVKNMVLSWILVFPGCGLISYVLTKIISIIL